MYQMDKKPRTFPSYVQIFALVCLCTLSSCQGAMERLSRVGKSPSFSSVHIPGNRPGTESYDAQGHVSEEIRSSVGNSLWQQGATSFFRDQRMRKIGDIIKVTINIQDKANLNNSTQGARASKENIAMPNFMGFEETLKRNFLPDSVNPNTLVALSGSNSIQGNGQITRQENIVSQIAAMVTRILPNGNLVIEGSQEIRVNYELREVTVKGLVRPQDVTSDNTVSYDQVAEARISYGGRGTVSDIQQPRLGQQVLEAVSPF